MCLLFVKTVVVINKSTEGGGGGGVIPYICYIGACGAKEYGFLSFLV